MNQSFTAHTSRLLPAEEALLRRSYDQLQAALSVGLVATWFWDIGSDKVYGDPNLLRLFDVDETTETVGLPLQAFTDNIHPEDRSRVTQLIDEAIRSGNMYETEYRIGVGDHEKWVLARGQLTYDTKKQPLTFSGILIDVTDRIQAEIRSQVAEAGLQLAVGLTQLGTWDYYPLTGELIWSDRTRELFSLSPSAAIDYNTFLQGLHPDDRAHTDQAIQDVLRPDSTGHFMAEFRTVGFDNGQLRWLRSTGQTFTNEQGVVYRFMGAIVDITSVKRNEVLLQQRVEEQTRKLEQQTIQLRTTLDASLNSIIAMTALRNEQGTIVDFLMNMANEAVIKSVFMTPDQIVGRSLLMVFPGNRENGFFDLYVRVVESGQAEQSTQPYRDEFGLEGWFEVSAVKQGEDGVVVTYNNITARKQAELAAQQQARELKEANAELKRSNESLQQFAHIASHDLQEPLRRIQSFSDLLKNQFADSLSDSEQDMVRRIQKSAQRMQLLIKDLLAYSKLATQREQFSPVALADVLNDAVSDLEVTISEKNATVDVGLLPEVSGSSSRLRQLFQNLIANALKFSQPNVSPLIQIRYQAAQPNELPLRLQEQHDRPFWIITVTDNGIGFDERYKDRIFTPFQRLHDPTTYSGTGIGLAICQRVTESHGGAMDVSSQPGSGSTFKVFLPVI